MLEPRFGCLAPNAVVLDGRGRRGELSSSYGDATLLAFVRGTCERSRPELIAARQALPLSIGVVEVCLGPPRTDAAGAEASYARTLTAVCDACHALSCYHAARPGTVLVVDRWGTITAQGGLEDLVPLCEEARSTADAVDAELQRPPVRRPVRRPLQIVA
jgi:hypothetical protein